ncbi:hypothetical protein [Photobacterium phosphoreum]|uniref:hypothetical protein n=1 Tax=Photobacterium phosphoreum TaxID=659 RepID=UPI000A6E41AA|nr:hypothetical protein [Photobacterium phosphoreum]
MYRTIDIKGLQDEMGGQAAFAKNLDAIFTAGSEGTETADMSGMVALVKPLYC